MPDENPILTDEEQVTRAVNQLNELYHRLFYMNQEDQQRSRELSLAITNLQQAGFWITAHQNVRNRKKES